MYVDVAGRCVGVVGTRATAVPCALRTALDRLPDVVAASVRDGVLHLDDAPLVVGRLVDVTVPRLAADRRPRSDRRGGAGRPRRRADAVRRRRAVRLAGGAPRRRDRHAGRWTPTVRAPRRPTTLLSATLLDCALHGEVIPEFAAWVAALGTAAEEPGRAALARGRATRPAAGCWRAPAARSSLDLERVAA